MRCLTAWVLLAAASIPARGQSTWTVDDDGGPGVQFTAIQPAVDAAQDGDVVLVAAGVYAPFVMAGKALSVVGAGVGLTIVGGWSAPPTEVRDLPQGSVATLARLTLSRTRLGTPAPASDAHTAVIAVDVTFLGGAVARLARARFDRCAMIAQPATPGLAVEAGDVVMSNCVALGGDASSVIGPSGGQAGPGVLHANWLGAPSGVLEIADCYLEGGEGYATFGWTLPAGEGLRTAGVARVFGPQSTLVGGAGDLASFGWGGTWFTPAAPAIHAFGIGSATVHHAALYTPAGPATTGAVVFDPTWLPTLQATSPWTPASALTLTAKLGAPGAGGAPYAIAFSFDAARTAAPAPFVGDLWLADPFAIAVAGGLDATGAATLVVPAGGAPLSLAWIPIVFQTVALDPTTGAWGLGQSTTVVFTL